MSTRIFIITFLLSNSLFVHSRALNNSDTETWDGSPFPTEAPVDYPVDLDLMGFEQDPFIEQSYTVQSAPPGFEDYDGLGREMPVGNAIPAVSLFAGFYAFFIMFKKRKQKQTICKS